MKKKYSDLPSFVKAEHSRKNYNYWKSNSIENNGFFIIFNGFMENDILKRITGNALKLYIFFGINSKNDTGESFYSIKQIAKYFDKSERTINNWIKELEDVNLIKRYQLSYNNVAHTFLQPYDAGRIRPNPKKENH